jgi:glycine oxidase
MENPIHKKYLIVGAGLAGSTLALELKKRNQKVDLVDQFNPNSSSQVAAGIFNPIVPRNVARAWHCDDIFPQIFDYYSSLETQLGSRFLIKKPTLQIHKIPNHTKNWKKRSREKGFEQHLKPLESNHFNEIDLPFEAAWCLQTGRLDVKRFLKAVRNYLEETGSQWNENPFNYNALNKEQKAWKYNGKTYDGVVFSEGIGMLKNPYFNCLPLTPTGGDILKLKIKSLDERYTYKRKEWLTPLGNNEWLAGSTFRSGDLSITPEKENADFIILALKEWMPYEMELLDHKSAPRPTVGKLRPFMGEHPKHNGLFVYNGLGSKGSSLCSWLSPLYAESIITGENSLPEEVHIEEYFT